MFTPQQIDQVSFGRSTFGGYDMQQVDEFLEPLTEDYVTLYKENALLKSKMRVLVGKLEEYRKNEASMKDAVINAQKTCDKMVAEAQAKCAQMLNNASATAAATAPAPQNSDALVAAENARVQEARKAAAAKIGELQEQLRTCIQALDRIKAANAPAPEAAEAPSPVQDKDVADEIAQNHDRQHRGHRPQGGSQASDQQRHHHQQVCQPEPSVRPELRPHQQVSWHN